MNKKTKKKNTWTDSDWVGVNTGCPGGSATGDSDETFPWASLAANDCFFLLGRRLEGASPKPTSSSGSTLGAVSKDGVDSFETAVSSFDSFVAFESSAPVDPAPSACEDVPAEVDEVIVEDSTAWAASSSGFLSFWPFFLP